MRNSLKNIGLVLIPLVLTFAGCVGHKKQDKESVVTIVVRESPRVLTVG